MILSRRKKMLLGMLSISLVVSLFCVPIEVKRAINVEIASEETATKLDSMAGQTVTLLCDPASMEVTGQPNYEFVVIAVENEDGIFERLSSVYDNKVIGIPGLYVYPRNFIGGAIKNYNYGARNRFVFRGELSRVSDKNSNLYTGDYKLVLDSWDIVYPVHHWEFHIGPNNEFYANRLFVFDYLIP